MQARKERRAHDHFRQASRRLSPSSTFALTSSGTRLLPLRRRSTNRRLIIHAVNTQQFDFKPSIIYKLQQIGSCHP